MLEFIKETFILCYNTIYYQNDVTNKVSHSQFQLCAYYTTNIFKAER